MSAKQANIFLMIINSQFIGVSFLDRWTIG